MRVYDISDPTRPVAISDLNLGTSGLGDLAVQGKYAYALSGSGFNVIDVSNPSRSVVVATATFSFTSGDQPRILVKGRYAFIMGGGDFFTPQPFMVWDISNPNSPYLVFQSTDFINGTGAQAYVGGYVLVGGYMDPSNALIAFDVRTPSSTVQSFSIPMPSGMRDIALTGKYAVVLEDTSGNVDVYRLPGMEVTALTAGSVEAASLSVLSNAYVFQSLTVGDGLTVDGKGIYSQGAISITATNTTSTFNGSVSGTLAYFNTIRVGGTSVCLANGANCPAGAVTSTLWQENATNNTVFLTTSTRDVLLGGNTTATAGFIYDAQSSPGTSSLIIGGSTNTNLFVPSRACSRPRA
jgi:hypothetical protein